MIELNQVITGYRGQVVTPPISGQFRKGSLTAIIGENGIGKSTLLKSIAGQIPVISGDISFDGKSKRGISWLPQHSELDRTFPINVYDTVAMGCINHTSLFRKISRDNEARIEAALNRVGLYELAGRSIDMLSGGQFQRMLFARMLVQDSPILMMDEPFVGIDESTQFQLLALIHELHQSGKTIITVLHDISLVSAHFPQLLQLKRNAFFWGETPDLSDLQPNQFSYLELVAQ